jgi:hypothetical protein
MRDTVLAALVVMTIVLVAALAISPSAAARPCESRVSKFGSPPGVSPYPRDVAHRGTVDNAVLRQLHEVPYYSDVGFPEGVRGDSERADMVVAGVLEARQYAPPQWGDTSASFDPLDELGEYTLAASEGQSGQARTASGMLRGMVRA